MANPAGQNRPSSAERLESAHFTQRTFAVLIVDPDADAREMYRRSLQAQGFEVFEATDGREALVQIYSRKPDGVVLDSRLPYIDGQQLCALVRQDDAMSRTRLVVVTSDSDPETAKRLRDRGADMVFVKPVSIETLAASVCDDRVHQAGADAQTSPAPSPQSDRPVAKVRAHERYVSTNPPQPPPRLRCPQCDNFLQYDRSHVGGVSERHPEQWDYFVCATHGVFQYRHRTRKLRPAS